MTIPNGGNQTIGKSGDSKNTSTNPNGQDSNDTLDVGQAKEILAKAQKVSADFERRLYEQDKKEALKDSDFLDSLDDDRANKIVKSITDGKYKNLEEYKTSLNQSNEYAEIDDPVVRKLKEELDEMKRGAKTKELESKQSAWRTSLERFKKLHAEFNPTNDEDGTNLKSLMSAVEKLKTGDNYDEILSDAYALSKSTYKGNSNLPSGGFSVPNVDNDKEVSMEDYFNSNLKKSY